MTPGPDLETLVAALQRAASALPADRLPSLIGACEAAKARAWTRLLTPSAQLAQGGQPNGHLLDSRAMGEALGVPETWLREYARRGRIPCVRLGRYVRFDPAQVRPAVQAMRPRGR